MAKQNANGANGTASATAEVEQSAAKSRKTKMTIEPSRNGNHLVFTKTEFEEGLQVSQKRGILQVDTDEYDIDDICALAQKHQAEGAGWALKGQKDSNGFYEVVKLSE